MIQHYKIRSMGGGNIGDYYAKVSEQERGKDGRAVGDYYSKGESLRGRWLGEIAKKWGIEGREITPGDAVFAGVNEGRGPNGEKLGQRDVKERKPTFAQASAACRRELGRKPSDEEVRAKLGEMEKKGPIRFIDFTASLPKGFSIAAVTGNDEALRKLARESYEKAFIEGLSQLAARRVRGEGSAPDERETTGQALVATWEHHLSRSLDSHLHYHFLVGNQTLGKDGRWYALEAADMARAKDWAESRAASLIAKGAKELGYEIELKKDARGNVTGWDLAGISEEARRRLSGQNEKIKEAVAEFEKANGRKPSRGEEAVIQKRLSERQRKNAREVMSDEIHRGQIARLGDEWSGVLATVEAARKKRHGFVPDRKAASREKAEAEKAVASALRHLEERLQLWPRHVLETEALRASFGKTTPEAISAAVDAALGKEKEAVLIDRRKREPDLMRSVSTPGAIRREFYSVDRIAANAGTCQPLAKFIPSENHSKEQNEAVRAICETRDRHICVEGGAGTGKTHTMKYAKTMLEKAGKKVLVIAPTRAAANVWKKDGFRATTVAAYLARSADPANRKEFAGKTVLCDEAGMVSGKAGAELLRRSEGVLNQRLILIGDPRQTRSVEAMSWLSVLLTHSPELAASRVRLTEVRRQRPELYNRATSLMGGCARNAKGELMPASVADGVRELDALGWIHEVAAEGSSDGRREEKGGYIGAAARDYLATIKYGKEYVRTEGGKSDDVAILVAPTHEEIRALTDIVRAELKAHGAIDGNKEQIRRVAVSLGLTREQMVRPERYGKGGEWIVAKEGIAGLAPGEMAMVQKVVKVSKGKSEWHELVLSNGRRCRLSGRSANKIDVAVARDAGFAPGDKIAIRQNHKPLGVTNGDVYSVESVERDGTIKTACGKRIPPGFSMITHGYACTAEKSQGSKALRVIGCGAALDSERSYVLFSRGVDSCGFYTPDKGHFMRSVGCSGHRESVLDEVRTTQERRVEANMRAVAAYAGETKTQMKDWFVRVGENVRSSIKRHLKSPARLAIRMAGRMAQIQIRETARDAARQRREALAKAPALARAPRVDAPSRSSGGRER